MKTIIVEFLNSDTPEVCRLREIIINDAYSLKHGISVNNDNNIEVCIKEIHNNASDYWNVVFGIRHLYQVINLEYSTLEGVGFKSSRVVHKGNPMPEQLVDFFAVILKYLFSKIAIYENDFDGYSIVFKGQVLDRLKEPDPLYSPLVVLYPA